MLLLAASGLAADPADPADETSRPLIRRLGTIDLDLVEATPIVLGEKLWRLEWVRSGYWDNRRGKNYFRFRDPATGAVTPPFADDHEFASAFVEGGAVYVTGVQGRSRLNMFVSRDLENWETRTVLDDRRYGIFNASLCRAGDEYVLAFEIDRPAEETGVPFTIRFVKSPDLLKWSVTPPECNYTKTKYSAAPCLRWDEGWFYLFYLHAHDGYETRLARSRDLVLWEESLLNPVMRASPDDKRIANERLTAEQRAKISAARNINASDFDFCQWQGRLTISYSWGNQQGIEFLAEAAYDGSASQFLRGWFPAQ